MKPKNLSCHPGNGGLYCPFNGLHIGKQGQRIESRCDNCDFALCCYDEKATCAPCTFPTCAYAKAIKHKQQQ